MHSGKLALATLFLVGASSLGLQAQTTTYTDVSSFLAAVTPGYYLETFDSLPGYAPVTSPMTFSESGFSYSADAPNGLYNITPDASNPGDHALSTTVSTDPLTLTFTSNNVTAVGGDFFETDLPGYEVPGDVTVTLDNGTTETLTATAGTPQPFVGFTTSAPIQSLTITVPSNWSTVNNLYVGSAVPEPGAYALLASLTLTGSALLRRRRAR